MRRIQAADERRGLTLPPAERNLVSVRQLITLNHPSLNAAVRAAAQDDRPRRKSQREDQVDNLTAVETLLRVMAAAGNRFGGVLAGIGKRFLNTPPNERGSIFSTAASNTDFLQSLPLRAISKRSDFRLGALRNGPPTTIYVVLPVGRLESHFRWLRLIIQQLCTTLEDFGPYPLDRLPILLMLEEFAVLGHMAIMERAAAYFPGFGLKLWAILQDLTQLHRYYHAGWETFLGNAGVVQCFANGDQTTLEYIQRRTANLITPFELRTALARDGRGQLLMVEGRPPIAALRVEDADVDEIRDLTLRFARARRWRPPGCCQSCCMAACRCAASTSGIRSFSSKRRTVRYSTARVPVTPVRTKLLSASGTNCGHASSSWSRRNTSARSRIIASGLISIWR